MHLLSNDDDVVNHDDEHHDATITTTSQNSPPSSSWNITASKWMISPGYWQPTSLSSSSLWWCHPTKLTMTTATAVVRQTTEVTMEMTTDKAALPPLLTTWILPPQPEAADECCGGRFDSRSVPLLIPKCHPFDGESIQRDDSCIMDIQKKMMTFPAWHKRLDDIMLECSSFPVRLHRLLQVDDVSSIVSWDPHGRSFHIRNVTKFIFDVLPRYFHQTKLTSFRHQLRLYGFRQITSSSNNSRSQQHRGSYYHDFFVRDRPDLCRFVVVRRREQQQKRQGRLPAQTACGQSCRSLLPSPLPLCSPTLPVGNGPVISRSSNTRHDSKTVRSDPAHHTLTFYGISSHPLPPLLVSSLSSSSQRSTTTNHTPTSLITSHPTGKHHGIGDKDGGGMTSQTCHGVRRNHHDSGTIPFRPLSMKPRLPTVIMTKKTSLS